METVKSNLTSRPRPSGSTSGEREDSDPGDHDVISGADDGQAAEGEERRLTTRESLLSSGPAKKKSKSSSAYEATRTRTYKETWKEEFPWVVYEKL